MISYPKRWLQILIKITGRLHITTNNPKSTCEQKDSLYLSNIDQREIEPTPETKSDKINDDSIQTLTPNIPKEKLQFPI